MDNKPVITIDGPSGVGKSTAAKGLARSLGFTLVDTGALYRAVAWLATRESVLWEDAVGLQALAGSHVFSYSPSGALVLDGELMGDAIRTPEMSRGSSAVAKHPPLRQVLLGVQRELGAQGGIVIEGRDTGTVVFPGAEIKFFLSATSAARAKRRFLELSAKGEDVTLERIEADQAARDEADSRRAAAPLRRPEDAIDICSDDLNAEQVIALMLTHVRKRFPALS